MGVFPVFGLAMSVKARASWGVTSSDAMSWLMSMSNESLPGETNSNSLDVARVVPSASLMRTLNASVEGDWMG